MTDELVLFGDGLDQALPTNDDFPEWKAKVTQRLDDAIQHADINAAGDLVEELVKFTKASGKELTKVLYTIKSNWNVFTVDETFEDWAFQRSGLHRHTIERYVKVEELFAGNIVPDEVKPKLMERNLAELFPVANMIAQGYTPDDEQWKEILIQPDESSIRNAVRDVKQQEPRASALILTIDTMGSMWATKDNVRKFIGSLELTDDSQIVQQAIERIIRNSGMLR